VFLAGGFGPLRYGSPAFAATLRPVVGREGHDIRAAKYDTDVVEHHAGPDLFSLMVNKWAQVPVALGRSRHV
jgi:hypothetical protein